MSQPEPGAPSGRFAGDALMTMGASGLQLVMGLFSSILVARVLGPDGRGEYALIIVFVSMLVMVGDIGIGMASVYHLGQRKHRPSEVLGANTLLALVAAGLLGGVGLVVVMFFRESLFPALPGGLMLIALLMVPAQVYLSYMTMTLLGFGMVRRYNLIQILRGGTFLTMLVVLLLAVHLDVRGAIGAQIVSLAITAVVLFHTLRSAAGGQSFSFPAELIRDEVRYGLKTYAGSISIFLHQRADLLMINWWMSTTSVGLYAVAAKVAEELWLVSLAAGTVLFPRVAAGGDSDAVKSLTPRTCRSVLWITAAMSLVLGVPAHWVITTLFSDAFADAVVPFQILLIGTVSMSGARILQNDFAGRGRPGLGTYITMIAAVTNIGMNVALIPRYGLLGAAWATAFSQTLTFALSLIIYCRISGSRIAEVVVLRWSDGLTMSQYLNSLVSRIRRAVVS